MTFIINVSENDADGYKINDVFDMLQELLEDNFETYTIRHVDHVNTKKWRTKLMFWKVKGDIEP